MAGATCQRCGVDVGCGCNLVNGYCASCRSQIETGAIQPFSRAIKILLHHVKLSSIKYTV